MYGCPLIIFLIYIGWTYKCFTVLTIGPTKSHISHMSLARHI